MNLRQRAVQIVHRSSKALVTTALALGLAATILAPTTAQAGPLQPGKAPSYGPDLVPEMYLFVYENGSVRAAASVRNRGSSPAAPARFKLRLPQRHTVSSIQPPPGTRCSQSVDLEFISVTCSVDAPLPGGDAVTVEVFGKPASTGTVSYLVTVDPNNEVREASETNNFGSFDTVVLYVR